MITHIIFWHWWILAAILLVLELLSMTFYLLWIAIGAGVAGGIALLFPELSWQWQCLIFAVWSVLSVYLWSRHNKSKPLSQAQQTLNRRGTQYLGQIFTLDAPIVNGQGKLKVADGEWLARAEQDLAAGTTVKVIGCEGITLIVVAC